MTTETHIKTCPVCSSSLSIAYDAVDQSLTIRPENLPPLAKDCLEIVTHYRRLKNLGADWRAKHEPRGLIYASQLLEAAGPLGGAKERVLGLLSWLKESGKDFDLGTASSWFMSYANHLAAINKKARCQQCGESYWGDGSDCGRH